MWIAVYRHKNSFCFKGANPLIATQLFSKFGNFLKFSFAKAIIVPLPDNLFRGEKVPDGLSLPGQAALVAGAGQPLLRLVLGGGGLLRLAQLMKTCGHLLAGQGGILPVGEPGVFLGGPLVITDGLAPIVLGLAQCPHLVIDFGHFASLGGHPQVLDCLLVMG
jgi:hypothetical protein